MSYFTHIARAIAGLSLALAPDLEHLWNIAECCAAASYEAEDGG